MKCISTINLPNHELQKHIMTQQKQEFHKPSCQRPLTSSRIGVEKISK